MRRIPKKSGRQMWRVTQSLEEQNWTPRFWAESILHTPDFNHDLACAHPFLGLAKRKTRKEPTCMLGFRALPHTYSDPVFLPRRSSAKKGVPEKSGLKRTEMILSPWGRYPSGLISAEWQGTKAESRPVRELQRKPGAEQTGTKMGCPGNMDQNQRFAPPV